MIEIPVSAHGNFYTEVPHFGGSDHDGATAIRKFTR